MKHIIYPSTEGGVVILTPGSSWSGTIEELVEKDVPRGIQNAIVETNKIPNDRTFRNSWEFSLEEVTVNIDKAKAIWKNKWRDVRKPLLASLDIEFMKAVESGNSIKQAEIAAKKQELRDVTNTPIPGTTPEEIKSVWPEVLNDPI